MQISHDRAKKMLSSVVAVDRLQPMSINRNRNPVTFQRSPAALGRHVRPNGGVKVDGIRHSGWSKEEKIQIKSLCNCWLS